MTALICLSDELHRSDTMQEKLSLVARFGVSINFSRPQKKEFDSIVLGLAARESGYHIEPAGTSGQGQCMESS